MEQFGSNLQKIMLWQDFSLCTQEEIKISIFDWETIFTLIIRNSMSCSTENTVFVDEINEAIKAHSLNDWNYCILNFVF